MVIFVLCVLCLPMVAPLRAWWLADLTWRRRRRRLGWQHEVTGVVGMAWLAVW